MLVTVYGDFLLAFKYGVFDAVRVTIFESADVGEVPTVELKTELIGVTE
jgi:hypothetical protein